MPDIAIQSTVDLDISLSTADLHFQRALRTTSDLDISEAQIPQLNLFRALRTKIEGDIFNCSALVTVHRALSTDINGDESQASARISKSLASSAQFDVDSSKATANVTIQRALSITVDGDESQAEATVNLSRAISTDIEADVSLARLLTLYLKNPPLPPLGTMSVRYQPPVKLKGATLVYGTTTTLDLVINGRRLQGLHLVFTVQGGADNRVVWQKSTSGIPDAYLERFDGQGEVLVQSVTPTGDEQELHATVMVLPRDFDRLPKVPGNYTYTLWAYDLLGTNALLESGTVTIKKG